MIAEARVHRIARSQLIAIDHQVISEVCFHMTAESLAADSAIIYNHFQLCGNWAGLSNIQSKSLVYTCTVTNISCFESQLISWKGQYIWKRYCTNYLI